MRTSIATAMVESQLGELVDFNIRGMGVTPLYRSFATDGVRGPNVAMVFSDRGAGVRAPVVFYNRAEEAAARLGPGDFDWAGIFGQGIRWFHSGGIFASLSGSTPSLIVEAMEAAHAANAVVSFDLNYRARLWAAAGGRDRAQQVLRSIVERADVLVGNEEDLQLGLGISAPPRPSTGRAKEDTYRATIEATSRAFPRLRVIATSLRDVISVGRHRWSAIAWMDGDVAVAPTIELDVYDRVGGGDGFASGLFYGLLTGEPLEIAVRLGWAHGALVATYPGDVTMASLAEVRALAGGESARIQR
jgi:2-dehydro-3-deoxygluconokinase